MSYSPSTEKFAFAGDSHVYVFDCKDSAYNLESNIPFSRDIEEIMSGKPIQDEQWSGMGIKTIGYSIKEPHILAACALRRGVLEFWDTTQQTLIHKIESTQDENSRIRMIKWSPHSKDEMFVLNFRDQIKFLDVFAPKDNILKHTFNAPNFVETGEWHPRQQGKVLLASIDDDLEDYPIPYILLFEFTKKHNQCQKYFFPNENHELKDVKVLEMSWNYGEDVFLVVLNNGAVYLFTQDEQYPKMAFEKQNIGVSSALWIDKVSGDFVTSSRKTGALRIWNAANAQPKQMIKVSNHGILTVEPCKNNQFLLQLASGTVVLYDLKSEKIRFQTDVCHSAQVQDCQIHPSNPNLMGTVSFDSTLRVWDLQTMKLDQIFTDRNANGEKDRIIQKIAWYNYTKSEDLPQDEIDEKAKVYGKLCVIGTSAGWAKLIDLNKNKVLWKQNFDGNCIYGLDWHKDGSLAIAPTIAEVSVFKFSRSKMTFTLAFKLDLLYYARCIHISPLHKDLTMAIGTFDGHVIVKSQDGKIDESVMMGSQRILCIQWHPVIEGQFAVGTFDNSVYVCNLEQGGIESKKYVYHTDRVRSLTWNQEIPWLLITASDDQQVVLWDTRHQTLLANFVEPSLALTQFTYHPARPFRYFSCHFDSSVMCWSLLSLPEVALSQIKFLLYSSSIGEQKGKKPLSLSKEQLIAPMENIMESENRIPMLSGYQSNKIASQLSPCAEDAIENYENVLKFFQVQDGQEEFWNMASIISGAGPKENTSSLRINHISDITFVYQTKARELKEVSGMKMLGTALAKKEDRLIEAANLYLKSGNFQEYCELQKEVGNYEEAMSVAPKVSLQYWQKCVDEYKNHLHGQLTGSSSGAVTDTEVNQLEEFVDYCILSGDLTNAETALEKSGFAQQAKLLRINELNKAFPEETVVQRHELVNNQQQRPTKSVHQLGPDDQDLLAFTNLQAQKKFIQREPLLSASIHLSLNDPRRAIQKLILSNNYEHAFVLANQFDKDSLDHVVGMLFRKTIEFQDMSVTDSLIGVVRNAQIREVLEIASMRSSEQQIGEIRSQSARIDPQSVFEFIAANRISEAASNLCKNYFDKNAIIAPESFYELYIMSFFELSDLNQNGYTQIIEAYRDAALIKALYFKMFGYLKWLLHTAQNATVIYSKVRDFVGDNSDEALEDLTADTNNKFLQQNFASYYQFLKMYMPSFAVDRQVPRGFKNVIVWLSQANLSRAASESTTASTKQQNLGIKSSFSGRFLNNIESAVELNASQKLFINFEEALDFQLLMPYNLFQENDRKPFNPFFATRKEPTAGKEQYLFNKQQQSKSSQFIELL